MKIFRLPDRLDRMPMLKILVFFAAGIALAGRYELPLWFLAGAFVVTGVLALSLRSSAATAAMILTAGFAAAQFRSHVAPRSDRIGQRLHVVVYHVAQHRSGSRRRKIRDGLPAGRTGRLFYHRMLPPSSPVPNPDGEPLRPQTLRRNAGRVSAQAPPYRRAT